MLKKYKNSGRRFKESWINAYCDHAQWFIMGLFSASPFEDSSKYIHASASNYPRLFTKSNVCLIQTGRLMRFKKNRIKYWPEVKQRLKEIGVKF